MLLLPGLDGTGRLFERFRRLLPPGMSCEVMALPEDGSQTPAGLAARIIASGAVDREVVIVAESFSGPIAFEIALRRDGIVKGVVFVASFLTRPNRLLIFAPWVRLEWLPWHWVPAWAMRFFFVDWGASLQLVSEVQNAIRSVPVGTIARRVRVLAELDDPSGVLQIPCLLLRPTIDRLVSEQMIADFERCCADLSVVAVNGPHFLLQTAPNECSSAILSFIDELGETERV